MLKRCSARREHEEELLVESNVSEAQIPFGGGDPIACSPLLLAAATTHPPHNPFFVSRRVRLNSFPQQSFA